MSNISSDHLFRLVKSLTSSEKRQFKIFSERISTREDKKFILLFNSLDSMEFYNEQKILSKHPEISKIQLPNLKAHLYEQILKSLRFTQTSKDYLKQITTLLESSRILYHKCLYNDALLLIDRAKMKARRYDSKPLLLEILELERMAMNQGMKENTELRSDEIIRQTQDTTRAIQNMNTFSNLAVKLTSYYQRQGSIKSREDLERTKKYLQRNLPQYNEKKLSFAELMYLYSALSGYYLFTNDFKKALVQANKWVRLFDAYPEMRANYAELYIKSLNALLVVQNKLHLYDQFMRTHRQLVAIKRDRSIFLTRHLNLNLFKTIYIHEINRHFMLGEFKSGTRIVNKLHNELSLIMDVLDKNTILIFYYKIGCLYFGSSNFKAAVKWLNLIIIEPDTDLREDLHSFARILRLICYFELGDNEMIEMNLRATYRFLLSKKIFGKYGALILRFLRDAQSVSSVGEVIEKFRTLKEKMLRLEKSKYERRAFIYFDIISYLESKIEKKGIEEKVKEKVALKLNNSQGKQTE